MKRKSATSASLRKRIGWREWVALPEFGIGRIKAKIDTGARSSALHARHVRIEKIDGVDCVTFTVQPMQRKALPVVHATGRLVDERYVTNSGGKRELRPVIETDIVLGTRQWPIEITLTNRDVMGFRMLLGRQALRERFVIDPGRSYLGARGKR